MARVIRGGGGRVLPAALGEARDEAARILEAAREEARAMQEQLRAELAAEAREAARAELAAGYAELGRARREALEGVEAAIGELAVAVAERIVFEALEAEPERVRTLVREATDRVRRATRVRVRVSPLDAAQLLELDAEVVEDDSITRGGCVVETELGDVDARLEVRLEALARALGEAR